MNKELKQYQIPTEESTEILKKLEESSFSNTNSAKQLHRVASGRRIDGKANMRGIVLRKMQKVGSKENLKGTEKKIKMGMLQIAAIT